MSLVQTLSRGETPCSSNDISERSSQRTFTETSTVWGPGTLSGRALLALGGATVRGIDALLIRRKMLAIRQRAPANLTSSMYNDLLELCRPAIYSPRIVKAAIRLTLVQVCAAPELSRYTVVVFLCKWPRLEARLILFELIRSLSEAPPGWELEKFYDFLLAIIQVKERWRSFIAEAILLLQTTFPPLVNHPAHIMASEVAAGLPESPLSLLQDAYSVHMRLNTWRLLHSCGLPLRDRMLKIERILLATPDASKAATRDAIVDLGIFMGSQSKSSFDFGIRSSALSCLQGIPGTRWESVYEASGLPLEELGNGFALEECTVKSFQALIFLQKAASNPSDDMCEDLLRLCLPSADIAQILTEVAVFMTSRRICLGSERYRIRFTLGLSTLPGSQIQEVLKRVVTGLPMLLNYANESTALTLNLCDFLARVWQTTGEYITADVAAEVLALEPRVEQNFIKSFQALILLKKVASNPLDMDMDMCKDLLTLCLSSADIAQILTDLAVSSTLRSICLGPEFYRICFSLGLSALPGGQIQEVLKRLLAGLRMHSNYVNESTSLANLCEYLVRVWQTTGESIATDVAAEVLALEPRVEQSFIKSLQALIFLRKAESNLSDDMYEDLFRLCLPSADIAQTLIDAAVSLTLKRICLASERYGIRVAHWLSKLPGGQIPEVLKRLVTGLPMLLNYANESTALALNLCEFLARVWQITGENITTDIAAEVLALEPRVDHNIIDICSQIVEGKEITPLSALQANSPNARLKIWTDLQALCDPRLEARMVEIEHILAQSSNLAPHQYFDAVTDIAILNRDSFKPFKPQLTSRAFDCLLRYCKSEQYAKFYEGLYHVPDFLCKLELMIMEMPERVPMSELHYLATLSGVLRCWITPLRLFPYDERREL